MLGVGLKVHDCHRQLAVFAVGFHSGHSSILVQQEAECKPSSHPTASELVHGLLQVFTSRL
eukprot:5882675-Amphidinium_carterae.1